LETAATETETVREGANTLFEGQQINGQTHREERRRQIEERTQRGEKQKRNRRNITEQITE
jgi:hypothetical protein